ELLADEDIWGSFKEIVKQPLNGAGEYSDVHVCPCVCRLIQKPSRIRWISSSIVALLARRGLISSLGGSGPLSALLFPPAQARCCLQLSRQTLKMRLDSLTKLGSSSFATDPRFLQS
ncbi:uncharacterized, partial [Tachysurus ichikawai]